MASRLPSCKPKLLLRFQQSLSTCGESEVRGIFFRAVALASLPGSGGLLASTAFRLPGRPECLWYRQAAVDFCVALQAPSVSNSHRHARYRSSKPRFGQSLSWQAQRHSTSGAQLFSTRLSQPLLTKQALPRPEFPASAAAICDAGSDVATLACGCCGL